ncbi:ABC transporter permease [Undibacterium sp. SXout11W]|uniref:ABC transporter permease n=1 Tax=Undibacterium sp. SXout11W TaxID=3413050 RepID=UPI003BF39BD0
MNPHARHSISPIALLRSCKQNRGLIFSLVRREVLGRYKGSVMGLFWSFFNPILMLAVYTFVFSVVFKARWNVDSTSKTEFALVLFAGLLIFNIFSECVTRAPGLILGNVNYVKKVIFPLEILPVIALGASFFHFLVSLSVWLLFYLIFFGLPSIYFLELPLVMIPLLLLALGLSWFLSSLGVYIRDIGQIIGVSMTVLMFLTPIFYPLNNLPIQYQSFMQLNPMTFIVEQARDLMIWGKPMDWSLWSLWMVISSAIATLGFAWFQKTRKGFADVL